MRPFCLSATLIGLFGSMGRELQAQSDSSSGLRLELNLAATRVTVIRHDSIILRFRVAIGQPAYPTPTGSFAITSIEWNPWWIPPSSDWARGEAPRPPGPTNPMGRVKLNFKPLYFLHGTPEERSIGTAASHGCVRLLNHDAVDLASVVMRAGISTMDSTQVTLLRQDTTTTSTWLLEDSVPIEIGSRTIEVERDTVFGYPDPYRAESTGTLATRVFAILEALPGHPGVDSAAVATFASQARRAPTKAAVRELIRSSP